MYRDKLICAWSKWLEALELRDDGLLDRWELAEHRTELFAGVGRMRCCREAYCARLLELDEESGEEESESSAIFSSPPATQRRT
jgi:hypothetical protein